MDVYQLYLNGSELVFENANLKPCLRKCLSLVKWCSDRVEFWYTFSSGKRVLVRFWN